MRGRRFANLGPNPAPTLYRLSASTASQHFAPGGVHDDLNPMQILVSAPWRMSALGHVWTAPWQELSDVAAALVGCGHVSGLFVRRIWPLALMLCADRVPIESTHFKVR